MYISVDERSLDSFGIHKGFRYLLLYNPFNHLQT